MILSLCVRCLRSLSSALILLPLSLPFLCSCSGYVSSVTPRISVAEEYTDNRDLTHSNPKSDSITTVSPGITVSRYGPTSELGLSYNPSFVYYAQGIEGAAGSGVGDQGGQFANRQNATLYAWDRIQMHSLVTLSDTFTRTDDPVAYSEPTFIRTDQPLPPVDETIRTSRQPYETNFANVGFRQEFGLNDSLTFNYANTILNNDDPTIQNNTTNSPSVDLTYWFNTLYGIDLKATYLRGDYSGQGGIAAYPDINETVFVARFIRRISPTLNLFLQGTYINMNFEGAAPNTPTSPASIFTDFSVYDVTAGVDYHLSPTVFLTMSGGYFVENVDIGKPASGYEVHADMGKQFNWGSVRLTGSVGYDESFFGAQNLGLTKYYGATLAGTYSFTQRLTGIVSADYRNNDYVEFSSENANLTTLLAGLTYQFRPWMSFTARYTHHIANSQETIDSYTENRATLIMTLVPKEPYLLGR